MRDDSFELRILNAEKADVYLSCPDASQPPWPLVRLLDQASVRVLTDLADAGPSADRGRRIMGGCAGVLGLAARRPESDTVAPKVVDELRHGAGQGLPLAVFVEQGVRCSRTDLEGRVRLQLGDGDPIMAEADRVHGPVTYGAAADDPGEHARGVLTGFQRDVMGERSRARPYAFLIGRLERDFTHAREAIRAAVESEAGIPCLWSDDGRHVTNVESIRERTRLLIREATFVIADLTLGTESPERENPSRAHEIGMAVAYDRPLLLCSREPRRYPYFSIGDMQMTFWETEAELASCVTAWIHARREVLGRQVLNHRLATVYPRYEPRVARPEFRFDPARRYVGPRTNVS